MFPKVKEGAAGVKIPWKGYLFILTSLDDRHDALFLLFFLFFFLLNTEEGGVLPPSWVVSRSGSFVPRFKANQIKSSRKNG